MRRFFLPALLIGAAVLAFLAYFALPPALERLAAARLQDRLGLAETPAVELAADPRWEMLLGRFSGARITAENVDLGGMEAQSATVVLDEPFAVDVSQSIENRTVVPRGSPSGRLRAELSEAEVSRLVRENAGIPIRGMDMGEDGVTVESEASVLGITLPVTVEGELAVRGDELVFVPRRAEAAGTDLPGPVMDEMRADGFGYPLDDLPYGATVTEAHATEGALVIRGRVPALDLGGLPAG